MRPRSCAADCELMRSFIHSMKRVRFRTATCTRLERCSEATTTQARADSECRSLLVGSPAVGLRNYEREPAGSLSRTPAPAARGPQWKCSSLSRCRNRQRVSPSHVLWCAGQRRGRPKAGHPDHAGTRMRQELEAIVGAGALTLAPVRDLWPLAIMEERAGREPWRVLVARPSGRGQVASILRWAVCHRVAGPAPRGRGG